MQGTLWSGVPYRTLRNLIKRLVTILREGQPYPGPQMAFLVTWPWGSRGTELRLPLPSLPAWLHTEVDRPCGHPRLEVAVAVPQLTPLVLSTLQSRLCPVWNLPGQPLPPGLAPSPTKGLLFPGPPGLQGQDWVEAIWALAPGLGTLPAPPFFLPSLPPLQPGPLPPSPGF